MHLTEKGLSLREMVWSQRPVPSALVIQRGQRGAHARLGQNEDPTCMENLMIFFKLGMTLSQLTRVNPSQPSTMNSSVVYRISCSLGKMYIGDTTRRLGEPGGSRSIRMHAEMYNLKKSLPSAEHAWNHNHPIL